MKDRDNRMFNSVFKKIIVVVTFSLVILNVYAQETLIFAFDIIRHGDRTPLLAMPNSTYPWTEGMGQLTARGMRQELQRGDLFRKRYIQQYHLLPVHYQTGTMYVFSTDFDRTLMSAQSVLIGLYGLGSGPRLSTGQPALPVLFQPIPIHTQPKKSDPFVDDDNDPVKYKERVDQFVTLQSAWKQKTNEIQAKFKHWNEATGLTLTDLDQLGVLADTLHIYEMHRIPLPAGLSHEDAEEIIRVGLWGYVTKYKTPEIANIVGVPLLLKIADYFNTVVQPHRDEQKTPLKYVLFSAHDTTILSTMTTLGTPLDEQPPYASNLNFSLFKTDAGDYIVRVSYNDKPVNICNAGSCSLDQFMQLVGYHPQDN